MVQPILTPDLWISNYADALYGYTLQRINDREFAEDIVQETFLSAWKARDSFKGESSEKSWLYTICKNKIIDHYRKKTKNLVHPFSQNDPSDNYFDAAEHWTDEDKPGNWHIDYHEITDKKEFYKILTACKKKLQDLQQSVFVMKYMEDLDTTEICKALGITPSNYWVLIHRAKLQLRTCLEKNWINSK